MGYKRYTKEFKDEAVKLCLQPDANKREIADNLGIKYKTICSWISKATYIQVLSATTLFLDST